MKSNTKIATLFSLMMVLFLDGMGQGIVFPILSQALIDPQQHVLIATATPEMRNLWYGILIGVFFLCWFIGAALLSDLSDKSGRKKALIICLIGSLLGNFVAALAFTLHSLWLLLVGRMLVGFTNGSQPIAQAAVVDISPKNKLSRYLGYVIMAVSIGLIAGPLIGGFLSDHDYVRWFSYSTPLYFAALLAFVNILLLIIYFKETGITKEKTQLKLTRALEIFVSAFRHPSVRFLSICYLLLQIGWSIYYIYISAFMVQKFNLSLRGVSILFAFVGVGLTFGLAVLPGIFEKQNFNRKHVTIFGYSILFLGLIFIVFPNKAIWPWIMIFPLTCGLALAYSFLISLYSNEVRPEKQGWIMGITSAIVALGAAIASFLEAVLSTLNVNFPYYAAIVLIAIGISLMTRFKPKESER
ncbi:MFS transporter [Coxiella burnetii]|uniref:MFS transporter n=1 Tax=Coxiella burnetii TaxID=777 RepID=UPI000B9593FD|nr:MFS transporter [Coxiella burnetii]OYK80064.1 MFS transporter [Coxiella burnetii]